MGEGRQYWESPEGPYAEFSGGNPEIQETGPQGPEERFKGQRLNMGRAAPRGPRHSSPQPRELIRVWACLSSVRRTWNLSAERDMATGWAGAPGAAATSSRRCTKGSSTERSRLELRV